MTASANLYSKDFQVLTMPDQMAKFTSQNVFAKFRFCKDIMIRVLKILIVDRSLEIKHSYDFSSIKEDR